MGCCRGLRDQREEAILARLAALGVALPDGAQLWGPRDDWAWHVVDRYGRDPVPPIGSPTRVTLLLATPEWYVARGPAEITVTAA